MRLQTAAEEVSPISASKPVQEPALRYVLAVGAVSAGLTLGDIECDSDVVADSVVSDSQARLVARSWGIKVGDGPGEAPDGSPGTVVVLVDGLGLEMLRQRRGHTPTLRRWLAQQDNSDGNDGAGILTCRPRRRLRLTMLGTSALPGTTGMVGYSVLKPRLGPTLPASTAPRSDQVLSLITWKVMASPAPDLAGHSHDLRAPPGRKRGEHRAAASPAPA